MKQCNNCGSEIPEEYQFCGICGSSLYKERSDPLLPFETQSKRTSKRFVTVLFADLTNFTKAASKFDPEDIYYTLQKSIVKLAQPITRHGGQIDRYVGDGFLATFGVPIAHEDDSIRALFAALEMQSIIDSIQEAVSVELEWDVNLRIGINSGQVISGQFDQDIVPESSVFGHTVNLARRLQEAARPGTILVSEEVHRYTSSFFLYNDPIQLQLKGLDKPVIGYELIKKRKTIQTQRGLIGRKTPLIGRDKEYQTLLSALQKVKLDEIGIIALISGEAGIGKSRLIEEVITPIADNYRIIKVACASSDSSNYQLLIDIIEKVSGIQQDDTQDNRNSILNSFLSSIDTLSKELQNVIQHLITTSDQRKYDEPQEFQRLLYVAMRRLFAWLAKNQSIILIIDDLQWADPSSINILTICADLVRESPIALILITRTYFKSELPKIFVQPQPTYPEQFLNIDLHPLTTEDSDHLIHLLLSKVPLPDELLANIIDRSDGNPLMIEEIVRMLLDRRIIYKSTRGWEINEKWHKEIRSIPETVYGLILNRYDGLKPLRKKILDAASVLESGFSVATLNAITEIKINNLRKQISYLEQSDFLRRSATTRVPVYFFRHALLREAIYNTILQSERQRLHLKAAQVIQDSIDGKSFKSAVKIGHHLERGHSPQAIIYLMEVAKQAETNFANQEAIAYYKKAQTILHETGPRQDLNVDTTLGIGRVFSLTNDLSKAKNYLHSALTHSLNPPFLGYRIGDINYELGLVNRKIGSQIEALNAFEAAHTALLEAPTQSKTYTESDIDRNIGWIMMDRGKLNEAKSRAEKSLHLAKRNSDLTAMAYAYNLMTAVHYWSGNWSEAVEAANNSLKIRESMGNVWGAASTQSNLGFIYYRLGDWEEAERILRQAIFVQQEIGDYHSLGLSWNNLGLLLLDSNRKEDALYSMNQALATLSEQDLPQTMKIMFRINRGYVYIKMENYDQAFFDLNICINKSRDLNKLDLLALSQAYLAEANIGMSRIDEAKSIIDNPLNMSNEQISDEIWAEVHRVNSIIEYEYKNWSQSLDANHESKKLYLKLGNKFETALRDIEDAEIQIARNKHTEESIDRNVYTRIQSALKHFRKLNLHHQISRAENLLSQIKRFDQTDDELIGESDDHLVSVIFFKIDPSIQLSDSLDQQELIATNFDRLKVELRKTGTAHGAVVTVSGQGLTFLLSDPKPKSNQDLALKAIRSALATIDTASRLNRITRRQYGFEIPIRVGIVCGRWQGPFDSPQETAIFSNVSPIGKEAQSIAEQAQNNQILLTEEIANVIRNEYEIEEIDSADQIEVKGSLFRLGRARSEIVLPQALPKSSSKLIGRDDILRKMKECIDRISEESQGIVSYIEGEAGMGKTRLLEEILTYAEGKLLVLQGKSESFRSTISFWPLIDMLDQAEIPETPANRRLKSLLGLRAPDELDDNLFRNIPPENLRPELFGRVREFLLHEASQKPILLVFEDVHCIDLSSLDLLDYLLPLTLEKRISIFMIARAEMPGPHRAIVSKAERVCQDHYLHIEFSSLSDTESLALTHNLLESDSLPPKLWNHLQPFTGHPLSLEEALRFLVERGWLRRSNGSWVLSDFEKETDRRMPTSYRELLLARLNNLENETLHVLQAAAVLGENFDRNVLSRIVPGPTLHGRLTELAERGWLYQIEKEDTRQHRFKHTLTRETIYKTLMASKRQVLHQRSGEAIENLYPESEEENSELLAYHFGNSSQREKAVHYLLKAADKSAARHALAESLNYYQNSRKLLNQDQNLQARYHARVVLGLADVHLAIGEPNSAINDIALILGKSSLGPSADIRAALLRRLGSAKRQMGEFDEALNNYQNALSTFNSRKYSTKRTSNVGIDSADKEYWRIELGIAQTYFDIRENDNAFEKAEYIISAIDHTQYPQITAETFNLRGGISFRQGDIDSATEMVQQSIAIYQSFGNRSGAAATYSNLGILAASQQNLATAHDNFTLSLAIREALGDSLGIAITRNNLGQLEKDRGRFTDAMNHLKIATRVARNSDLTQVLAQSLSNLGLVEMLSGKLPEAISALDEAKMLSRSYNFHNLLCEILWKLASCHLEFRDLPRAEKTALEAIELATELESQELRSESQRTLSRIYRKMGETQKSLSMAKEAWEAREGDASQIVRARFAGEYALALIANGEIETAKQLVNEEVSQNDLHESSSIMQELNKALGNADIQT